MDGVGPIFIAMIVVIVVLLVTCIGMILICRDDLRRFFRKLKDGAPLLTDDVTEEEIISMVKEGHEQGVLEEAEAEMIHNIFEFDEKEAQDIMTHRKNIDALDASLSYTDAVVAMLETNRSRYPVYREDIDQVIGVLHIKDAFAFSQHNEIFRTPISEIPDLIREVEFVPETTRINELFRRMQAEKTHMVMVVDEYGQTAGLVAMEDILEEIVGNIQDEHDEEEELIRRLEENVYQMDGMAALSDVVELLQLDEVKDSFDTLSGMLISLLDKIPSEGDTPVLRAYGCEFAIQKVEDKMIREVIVRKLDDTASEQ